MAKIGQKKVVLHYELVVSTLRRKIFLGVCGFFLRNVGVFFADIERLKVKRYLFSRPHFFILVGWEEKGRGGKRRGGTGRG